ncbi:MAG: Na/Pi cotransporter family protein [Endomicrobiales bacterium]|nr:Na/Pi cotransporter family protein [Endomicrobiales bacterium]
MKKRIIGLLFIVLFAAAGAHAVQKITKVSGDGQTGIEGYPLKEDFVVRVLDAKGRPLSGVPVACVVLYEKNGIPDSITRAESCVSAPLTITDDDGTARMRLHLAYPYNGNVTTILSTRDTVGNPAIFRTRAHSKYWLVMLIFGLFGGLGVFLFGMFFLNDALQKLAGSKLKEVLVALTSSPVKGMSTGLFVTFFNQSSSATTLLEVSLVSAGLLTFYQTMAVTMGAEVGSTITAQLVAFRLDEYSILIAGLGFFVFFMSRTKKGQSIGNAILGFGILFLGMKIMADLVSPLRDHAPFLELMEGFKKPYLGILVGMLFAMLVHSSGAASGVVIALALAGAVSLPQAIHLNLGAQIGTCITAGLGSIGRGREGKRVALWHVIHQTAGVLMVYPFLTVITFNGEVSWVYFTRWFTKTFFFTEDLARQIAMAHTLVAALNALIFLPFLGIARKYILKLYPPLEEEKPFGPIYIDDGLISAPSIALEQAKKEVTREAEIALEMVKDSIEIFESQELRLCEIVSLKDVRVDVLRNAVVPYLTRMAQENSLTEEQSKQELQLIYLADNLEGIGDVIDKNVIPLARKKLENKLWFSDQGWKDIVELHSRVTGNIEKLINTLKSGNLELAKLIVETKGDFSLFESELRKRHVGRLHSGLQESLETSSVHLDLIDQLKRINSHTVAAAYTLLGRFK